MNSWPRADARTIAVAEEIAIATRRADGTLRSPTTIWVVGDGDRVFIRSTDGRPAVWFRGAIATGAGQLTAGGRTFDVGFAEADDADLGVVDDADLGVVDDAYRAKYRRYASITAHLAEPEPRAATLQVHPA